MKACRKFGVWNRGDGKMVQLDEHVERLQKGIISEDEISSGFLSSQGLREAKTRTRLRLVPKIDNESSEVRVLSAKDAILYEINRFAKNRPMIIIGVVMIMLQSGLTFRNVNPVTVHDCATKLGFEGITSTEARRVLEKINKCYLCKELAKKKRVALIYAYKLYLGK